jgi:hypothetical protein
MRICHLELKEANAYIAEFHRHHKPVQGHRFSIGVRNQAGELLGVSVVGRPVSGKNQHIWTEVTRLCTNGAKNVCSMLYAASARASRELGYERIQTYILADESGVSLAASGWQFDRLSHPIGWNNGNRPRTVEQHLVARKQLWYKDLR